MFWIMAAYCLLCYVILLKCFRSGSRLKDAKNHLYVGVAVLYLLAPIVFPVFLGWWALESLGKWLADSTNG